MRKASRIEGLQSRLRSAFLWSNKTAEQVQRETGIPKTSFYCHLSGTCTPNALHLARYAGALNVSADWLLGLKKEQKGGWIKNDIEIALELTCPVCGFMYTEADPKTEDVYKYCPECGAKNK